MSQFITPPAVTSAEQGRELAIDWQNWQSEQSLSWSEVAEWQAYFQAIADEFGLNEEFKENGIL